MGAKTSARIREITVREGDHAQAGLSIATLDDQQIRAREQQAEAAVRPAEARAELSRHQITVLEEDWDAARARFPRQVTASCPVGDGSFSQKPAIVT